MIDANKLWQSIAEAVETSKAKQAAVAATKFALDEVIAEAQAAYSKAESEAKAAYDSVVASEKAVQLEAVKAASDAYAVAVEDHGKHLNLLTALREDANELFGGLLTQSSRVRGG